jgi:hypothetical protein
MRVLGKLVGLRGTERPLSRRPGGLLVPYLAGLEVGRGLGRWVWLRLGLDGDQSPACLLLTSLSSFLSMADASDAKTRDRGRGTPLPTSSSKDASEAMDPR